MQDRELTAIVCSGGGMRSAHGAGFLYALATRLGITSILTKEHCTKVLVL